MASPYHMPDQAAAAVPDWATMRAMMSGSGFPNPRFMTVSPRFSFPIPPSFGGFDRHRALAVGIGTVAVDPLFDHVTEMPDQALHRPGSGIAQGTDGVALDLIGHVEQHVDLALPGETIRHPAQT